MKKAQYLGNLCKRGHEYQGTGFSLRDWEWENCIECAKIHKRKYYEKKRESKVWLESQKQYRIDNAERKKAVYREYYKKNGKKMRARARKWLTENREKARQRHREYYLKNKERHAANSKVYRKENRNAFIAYRKKYYSENKETVAAKNKEYQKKNEVAVKARKQKYRDDNKEEINRKQRENTINLSDSYMNNLLSDGKSKKSKEELKALMLAKRLQIRIHRFLKEVRA